MNFILTSVFRVLAPPPLFLNKYKLINEKYNIFTVKILYSESKLPFFKYIFLTS